MQKVYLLRSGDNYKIGRTRRSVEERVRELRTGSAEDQEIVAVFETTWASKIEARLHRIHRGCHVSGEWFRLEGDVKGEFLKECERMDGIYELLNEENEWFRQNIVR
jgi:hypothetical protein